MKQNKPITDRQVATFTKLIEQGMLQHLEDSGRWEVVDTVNEFLSKFRELPEEEIFATPRSAAKHFYMMDLEQDLLKAAAFQCSSVKGGDSEDALKMVAEELGLDDYYLDPYDQDEEIERAKASALEELSTYKNRRNICDMLGLGYCASTEAIIKELKTRIE